MKNSFGCSHCKGTIQGATKYSKHVKACIELEMATWDEGAYSERYYRQVAAISKYRRPDDTKPRQRSPFRSWAWWATVRPDGPALMRAEVAG